MNASASEKDDGGMLNSFSPIEPVKLTKRSAIFALPANRYFVPGQNAAFTVKPGAPRHTYFSISQ